MILFQPKADGRIVVKAKYTDGTDYTDEFDTVIFAIGRDAETAKLGLDIVINESLIANVYWFYWAIFLFFIFNMVLYFYFFLLTYNNVRL